MVKIRGRGFRVYSLQEAEDADLTVIDDWRKAQAGDWLRTTDDRVVQCIRVKQKREYDQKYTSKDGTTRMTRLKPVTFIVTGYGMTATHEACIVAKKQKAAYWNSGSGKQLIRDMPATSMQRLFVDYLFLFGKVEKSGMWTRESIIDCFQAIYSNNNPLASLRRGMHILKKKSVREYIMDNMKDELAHIGINDSYVAEAYKKLLDDDDTSERGRIDVLNRVSKLRGHDDKVIERTDTDTIVLSAGDKKMLAQSRRKISSGDMDNMLSEEYIEVIEDFKKEMISDDNEIDGDIEINDIKEDQEGQEDS